MGRGISMGRDNGTVGAALNMMAPLKAMVVALVMVMMTVMVMEMEMATLVQTASYIKVEKTKS